MYWTCTVVAPAQTTRILPSEVNFAWRVWVVLLMHGS